MTVVKAKVLSVADEKIDLENRLKIIASQGRTSGTIPI